MAKHLLTLLATLALSFSVHAQTTFKLTQTGHVGALRPEADRDWTKGWTNFDPVNTVYPAVTDTVLLNAMFGQTTAGIKNITTTVTLDSTKVYLLKGIIAIREGGKLVIPAGTVIRGQADVSGSPRNYAFISVERGGQIEVNGTKDKPVVMTSNKAEGSRVRGDWGGLAICGKARNNQANNEFQLEGFGNIPSTIDANLGKGGGTNDDDNSGIVRYCRIEFAGLAFEANREVNSLTMASVGRGTTIQYVQCSHGNDDAFEWFGGTVNGSYLIAWKTTDDDFDADFGYSGINQFGIGVKDKAFYDLTYNAPTGSSTSEGFEIDNDASGSGSTPKTNAIFSNFTMVGPIEIGKTYNDLSTVEKAAFRRGARIRRNASARILNSIFIGYRNFVMIDGDSCIINTNYPASLTALGKSAVPQSNQLQFNNNLICNTTAAFSPSSTTANGLVEVASAARLTEMNDWVRQTGNLANKIDPVAFTEGTLLVNPKASSTTPDFRPVTGSPALSGANFVNNPILNNLFILSSNKELSVIERPVFPNPVSKGQLFFGKEVGSYGIFDLSGRLIGNGFDTDRADVSNLAKGVYFIKLDGQTQKFIVQ